MKLEWLQSLSTVLVVAALPATGFAQDDFFDIDGIEEEEAPARFTSSVEYGIGWLDDDAHAFGKYTGLTGDGFTPLLDVYLERRPAWDGDSTVYWRFEGQRLGLDNRRLMFEAGEQGTQRLRVGFRQFPNNSIGGGQTPFIGAGESFQSLPVDWEATDASTAGMTVLDESLRTIDIGHMRRRLDFGYQRNMDSRWSMDLDYRRETKEGTRPVSAMFGSTGGNPRAAILAAPVDFVTDIFDFTMRYSGSGYQVGFAYHGSLFDNRQPSLTWQNPYGQLGQWAPGVGFPDGLGRIAMEPANAFHQVRAFGAWNITAATRLTGDVAIGRMTQDEPFLPYTVNPRLTVTEPLPFDSLDGRIDTTVINLRLTGRPLDRLHTTTTYRFDDRDNRTPLAAYPYIGGDSQDQRAADSARINRPYSFREHRFDLVGAYRMAGRTRLIGGYQYRDIERDISESSGSTEHTIRIGLRGEPLEMVSVSFDYRRSERDADPYDGRVPLVASHVPGTVGPDEFENHPLLRKFFLTDRDRDQLALRADWAAARNFNLGIAGSHSRDRYDDDFFGLNEGKVRNVTVDAGYYPSDTVSFTAWASRDRFDAEQSGRAFGPGQEDDVARNWFVESADRIDSFGIGFETRGARERLGLGNALDFGVDAVYSRSRTDIDVRGGEALTVAPLPELSSRLNAYTAYARYHISSAASVRVGVEHERLSTRDFALDGVAPDTLANVLGLGNASPNHSVNWITLAYRYRF